MPGLRRLLPPLLLLLAALCPPRSALRHGPARIAVVGGGIGGSAAAYFLRQKFGPGVQLHVLEKAALGGRLHTLDLEGAAYEAGGSVIHPLNLHMKHFVKELGAVSMAWIQSGLWSVKGGNKLVCSGLIYSSKAEVIPGTVVSIEPKTRPSRGVKLNGGRHVQGILRGFDPFMNLVIDECVEMAPGGQQNNIGMVVIRGNSIIMLEALERV
ncbi:hypothetical protein HGM15179_016999 [Zosterops borbonicus]|nr:hypothetical protein HGM15179_016999 [Zosterops borbonicus]